MAVPSNVALSLQGSSLKAIMCAAVGVGLGAVAVIPDVSGEHLAAYLNPFFSSGFAWGFAGLLTGSVASRAAASPKLAGLTLTIAVITYYGLIVVIGRRGWGDPVYAELDIGPSAGLSSVGRSLLFWAASAVVGGGFIGWLGWLARNSSVRLGSAAIGVSFALLCGEAVFTLVHVRSIYQGPLDAFDLGKLVPSLVQIVLAFLGIGVVLRLRRQPVSRRLVAGVGAGAVAASVLLWSVEIGRAHV